MSLELILEQLKAERPATMHNGRPAGRCCKYCNTMLAVAMEEPTVVHERNEVTQQVSVKCYYHGKAYCKMCHKYQA